MLSVFLVILIVLGLGGIGLVVIPKLSVLAQVNTESLPREQEARTKKAILVKRLEAEGARAKAEWERRLMPVKALWGKLQLSFRRYVGRIERLWHHEQTVKRPQKKAQATPDDISKLEPILMSGEQNLVQGHLDQAEEAFIAAIKINKRSTQAYQGLAETYIAKGAFAEAEETYTFLLQLDSKNDVIHAKLAELAEKRGDTNLAIQHLEQAVVINDSLSPRFYHLAELLLQVTQPESAYEAIRSAVDLEPKNPKYLDLLIETAILCQNQKAASEAFQELRLVNPENQKLLSFKERIEKIA